MLRTTVIGLLKNMSTHREIGGNETSKGLDLTNDQAWCAAMEIRSRRAPAACVLGRGGPLGLLVGLPLSPPSCGSLSVRRFRWLGGAVRTPWMGGSSQNSLSLVRRAIRVFCVWLVGFLPAATPHERL